MYIALMGCAQQGSAAPLAASVDAPSLIDLVDVIAPQTGSVATFTTLAGELEFFFCLEAGDLELLYGDVDLL